MNYVAAWGPYGNDDERLRLVKAGKTRRERGAFRWLRIMRRKGFFCEEGKIAEIAYDMGKKRKRA